MCLVFRFSVFFWRGLGEGTCQAMSVASVDEGKLIGRLYEDIIEDDWLDAAATAKKKAAEPGRVNYDGDKGQYEIQEYVQTNNDSEDDGKIWNLVETHSSMPR